MRILLIEDDATLGRALQEVVTKQGDAVDWLVEGDRALPAVKNYTYDLVVLDLNLPDVDGLEVLRVFRQEGRHIPCFSVDCARCSGRSSRGL